MAFEATNFRLFGLDLARSGDVLRAGFEGIARWPVFARLTPALPVYVVFPEGDPVVCRGVSFEVLDGSPSARAQLQSVVLPADIVLSLQLRLPHLPRKDIEAAIELQLQSASPLGLDEIYWGWRFDAVHEQSLDITVAFAPLTHARTYLDQLGFTGQDDRIEVWADVRGPVVLRGFGESRRQRTIRRHCYRTIVGAVLVLSILAALPVLHFLMVRTEVFDAQRQYAALEARAAPYVAARDSLVTLETQSRSVEGFLKSRLDVPWLIDTLTGLLPDSAWLVRLEVEGRRVRINGQAAEAAGLMEALRERREFSQLRALSAIARGRDGLDTFQFEFVVLPEEAWQ